MAHISSQDAGRINKHDRLLLDLCKTTNFRICNGRLGSVCSIGKYIYYASRGNSVIDYILATVQDFVLVQNVNINTLKVDSDHCAITLTIYLYKIGLPIDKKRKQETIRC